jgi:pimeloyl-ACP methyl ester carboxylesterase
MAFISNSRSRAQSLWSNHHARRRRDDEVMILLDGANVGEAILGPDHAGAHPTPTLYIWGDRDAALGGIAPLPKIWPCRQAANAERLSRPGALTATLN